MKTTNFSIQTIAPVVLTTDHTARTFKTITTILSDHDALGIVAGLTSDFARALITYARRNQLSHNRRVWVHVLAMDNLPHSRPSIGSPDHSPSVSAYVSSPAPAPVSSTPTTNSVAKMFAPAQNRAKFTRIVEMFTSAKSAAVAKKQQGTNLKIRLSFEGQGLFIKFAAINGRNAGFLYVTDGGDYENGTYFGKISPDGEFFPSRECTREITGLLNSFNLDPVTFAREFGRRTNTCCFCSRHLTDDKEGRSVSVGYGPVCADKFGLPWG